MRIAITGGIAEGKSTVLSFLAELGFETESADRLAKVVYAAKSAEIADVLGVPAPPSREAVREALSQSHFRRKINQLTHPAILEALRTAAATFFEVPLLVEVCLQCEFDEIWVVTCGAEEQRRRLVERLGSESEADSMLALQLPTRAKMAFADRIIRTNQPFEDVRNDVGSLAKFAR